MTAVIPDGGLRLEHDYVAELFARQEHITRETILALWTGEAELDQAEAERRLEEVLLVASGPGGDLAAVCTAFTRRNFRLRVDLWYLRAYVAEAHRRAALALQLVNLARDHLEARFTTGEDQRAIGIGFDVESPELKRNPASAIWPRADAVFIGENPRGDHVRVHFFPGALAPEPED